MFQRFFTAEFFKLRQNRTVRVTFIAMILTPVCLIGSVWNFRTDYTQFMSILQVIGGSLLLLLGLTSFMLTANILGDEYEQKTIRTIISRGIPRWFFIISKGFAVWSIALLNGLTLWFVGGLMAIFSHFNHVGTSGLLFGLLALLTSGLDAVAITLLAVAAYISIALLLAVLTRSTAFTIFGGLTLFFLDFYLQTISKMSLSLSIIGNITVLFNYLPFAMIPRGIIVAQESNSLLVATGGATAVLILLTYTATATLLAILLFQCQEIS